MHHETPQRKLTKTTPISAAGPCSTTRSVAPGGAGRWLFALETRACWPRERRDVGHVLGGGNTQSLTRRPHDGLPQPFVAGVAFHLDMPLHINMLSGNFYRNFVDIEIELGRQIGRELHP